MSCVGSDLDLTEVREYDMGPEEPASSPEVLQRARDLCAGCPFLVSCRREALRETDHAGFSGGMTEVERESWRQANGVVVTPVDIVDVTPAGQLTASITDDLPTGSGVPDRVVQVVLRMTDAGVTAEDIVTHLAHPAVTHRTVNYIRHRYGRGKTYVDT